MGKKKLNEILKEICANLDAYEENLLRKTDEELRVIYPLMSDDQFKRDRYELLSALRDALRSAT